MLIGFLTSAWFFLWCLQVVVTLATLSFFCRRPTLAAVLDFVSGINYEDASGKSLSNGSSVASQQHDIPVEGVDPQNSTAVAQSVAIGLLGKGKSRIVFYLVLNMARAQIVILKEDETKLATFSQDNFLTDIKVNLSLLLTLPLDYAI